MTRPAATALICFLSIGPLAVHPAHAETITVPGSGTATSGAATTVTVPVPPGVSPTRVTGRLRVDTDLDATVAFVVGGRLALRVPARPDARVTIPVTAADVSGDELSVQVRIDQTGRGAGNVCLQVDDVAATLDQVRLDYEGTEQAPTSLADFFSSYAGQVDVLVPDDAGDAEIAAGLAAVAAISSRYPSDTVVRLATPSDAASAPGRARAGHRVVRIEAGTGPATTKLDAGATVPTLVLAGGDGELLAAARALGDPALPIAGDTTTEGLTAERARTPVVDELSLDDLGTRRAVLAGYGRVEQYVGIRQDAFGGPVGALTISLVGTHTAVPEGARAQLDVYVNDKLVDSTQLDDDPALDREIEVPAEDVRGDNGLVVVLSALPPRERCTATDRQLPMEVHLDTSRSTVHADRSGATTTGFAVYPQALGGELSVAISDRATDRVAAAVDASYLVAALQRQAARPLAVSLVEPGRLLDGKASGLLVGAGEEDSTKLAAPLRLSGMRLLDYAEATFQVGSDKPYAALVAVHHRGNDVLVLGSWAASGDAGNVLERTAAQHVATDGWDSLSADLLVQTAGKDAFSIDSNAVVPQTQRVEEERSFGLWFVAGVAVLLLLLAGRWLVARRRKRDIAEIVDAQQAADADADGDHRD
ncbi:cellulose biosynthesis cyclic di-GMP-binding regulatory protein BcsB [Nocardioides sp. LML1-1-1.1]|uniref:cellulose biosynthesis cyclic di-GMP-binding regulatory protein BcsB n=1 Tax=Nocardioides sp. LML1-1-1.1 TaxID=3135248 RepID=UPI00341BA9E9